MRTLALALVVANVLVAAWTLTRPAPPPPPGAPPLAASPLVLLHELPPAPEPTIESLPEVDAEPVATATTTPTTAGDACQTLGAFADRDAMQAAAAALEAAGLAARPRAVDSSERLGFWVHTPAAPDRAAATAVVERLRRAGVRDYYVVVDGDAVNAVSLGVFRELAGAEQHAGRLRALGFEVEVGERRRASTAWWLDFAAPAGGSAAADAVVALALDDDAPLVLQPRPCE